MQTLEVVSAQVKNIRSVSAGRKMLLLHEIPAICEALDRIKMQRLKKPANSKSAAADRIPAGQIQCSHILLEKTGQAVENDALQKPVPLKLASCLHLQNLTTTFSLQLLTEQDIDQMLPFSFENSAAYTTCLISVKARQSVAAEVNAIAAGSGALGFRTKKYSAFHHPAACLPDLKYNPADANDTIYVVFHGEAYPASRRGFVSLQEAVSKVRNYHNLGKLKGRILNIKG